MHENAFLLKRLAAELGHHRRIIHQQSEQLLSAYCSTEQSPKCGKNNERLDKRAAVAILGKLLKRE